MLAEQWLANTREIMSRIEETQMENINKASRIMADTMNATNTPRMVTVCDSLRPIQLPPRAVPKIPAKSAPASGASGTASKVDAERA